MSNNNPTNDFKAGDVVMLKSGSPLMTVTDLSDKLIVCIWFVSEERYFKTEKFLNLVLEKVESKKQYKIEDLYNVNK